MKKRLLLNIDISILLALVGLISIGILFIYSSGVSSTGVVFSNQFIKQIIWAIIGLFLLISITLIRYDYLKSLSVYVFILFFLLVLLTLLIGRTINGARAWVGVGQLGIQPSEFLKIAFIMILANHMEGRQGQLQSANGLIKPILLLIAAMGAVLLQPDLGTAIVFLPVFLAMLYFGGAKLRYLNFILLFSILTLLFSVLPSWENRIVQSRIPLVDIFRNKEIIIGSIVFISITIIIGLTGYFLLKKKMLFYWLVYSAFLLLAAYLSSFLVRFVLKEYQIMRLIVFIDPYVDRLGSGWNIIQSVIAIGSGGLYGKGLLNGPQSHLQYLPEQSTDFIFSILSEEWGFIGGISVFLLYSIILFRGLRIARQARDAFGGYLTVGILTMLLSHFLINIGMTMGIMPVTGIPLLFISYGGSNLLSAMIGIGLILNVGLNRYRY
ncbi:rod shape-determining protein RodA [Spirochaeta lutea]|uniref:Peptidoglycan glycosyltransferase RodA n=1 Tax=Spirochaeta lutea TaxID=1480694 RepID=A0A098R1S5_9SPIO|nr:rod shape-determining protein RodA [Spirochaeta lutea]KGE73919.1 hypothetical protein DC28_01690 [Spirochaeta lutea]